ncbi:glycosyltransferase family 2 protein [Streptomyces decoyicus]|uniref:Glycosyltransferase n=1 Tax=Streptomyces decoyicus TaxID=249567 RepID=A0ABZ1FCZ4_9ACTN|nr:glycosyltransferase family 2 protein [Streptomyces decoyicus]WSB68248.1 glycosyltransferase [Streptomyces decoyicus]
MASRISVIVATRNRHRDVIALLESLTNCDDGGIGEVLLVDDASTHPLVVEPAEYPYEIRLIRNSVQMGAAESRNVAAREANGDVLAFLDDDARPLPDWCQVLSKYMSVPRTAVTGRILPFDTGVISRSRQYRYEYRYAAHPAYSAVDFFAGGNSAIRREVFLRAGGFPNVTTASDNGLVPKLAQLGYCIIFVPDLRVVHRNGKGTRSAFRESWRAARMAGPTTVPGELRRFQRVVQRQPWSHDPACAIVNSLLQAANSLSRTLQKR